MLFLVDSPRDVPDSITSSIVGGGTAFLLREPCKRLSTPRLLLLLLLLDTRVLRHETRYSIDQHTHGAYSPITCTGKVN